jgi:SAM-dependent methyltransferase
MLDYYKISKKASLQIGSHAGLIKLSDYCRTAEKILDVGCGEGSRLNTLLPKNKSGWGIDISSDAISKAKVQYPNHRFQVSNGTKVPFADNYFDLVYSAFTLEHTTKPKIFISEMFRVVKPGGRVIILCPNYGAPNRRSPVSDHPPLKKLFIGLLKDFMPVNDLNWEIVIPKSEYLAIDDDTTVEPYLHSLLLYLSSRKIKIIYASSVWDQELSSLNPRKLVITLLGKMGIFPFKYWGPQLFVVAGK